VSGTVGDDSTAASGLTLFAKYGTADEQINLFARHVMVGFETESPLGLEGHATGFLLSHVDLSDEAGAVTPGNETAFELFYRLPVTGNFTLRPDLQYITAPSGSRAAAAFVSTLRLELDF
jgi:carbohydrate-selective porin OprB